LFEWLDSTSSGTQVVSTASAPLLPLVEAGAFDDALYYRLNTVYVDLSE
jgi:transcriptional regulator of acetoin/glycerol metabolism